VTQFVAGFTGAAPVEWLNGDFDYNGVVNGETSRCSSRVQRPDRTAPRA